MKNNKYDIKILDKLFKLYAFLLQGRAGAYYWHYSLEYEKLKSKVLK